MFLRMSMSLCLRGWVYVWCVCVLCIFGGALCVCACVHVMFTFFSLSFPLFISLSLPSFSSPFFLPQYGPCQDGAELVRRIVCKIKIKIKKLLFIFNIALFPFSFSLLRTSAFLYFLMSAFKPFFFGNACFVSCKSVS